MGRALPVARPRQIAWPLWRHAGAARVAIGPDGRVIASAGADGDLRLGNLELGTATFTVALGGPASALACASSLVVVGVGDEALLVPAHGGRVLHRIALGGAVTAVAVAADGATAVVASADRLVRVRVATGRRTLDVPFEGATAVALDPAGGLVTGTARGELLTIGPAGDVVATVDAGGAVRALVATDGGTFALTVDGRIVDQAGRTCVSGAWTVLASTPRGRVGVGGVGGWGILEADAVRLVEGRAVADLALHPDGEHAALVDIEGAVGLIRG